MICVSIQNRTYEEIVSILSRPEVEMAELRLDLCPDLTEEQIRDLFGNSDTPLVATARGRADLLAVAIEAGARYADLEIDAPANESRRIQKLCTGCGTELIRSYHNFEETPDDDFLQMTLARCFRYGADMVKIATLAKSVEDVRRVLGLYSIVLEGQDSLEGKLIAFCMGGMAKDSRLECVRRGAPFTYASLAAGEATAPGQPALEELRSALYHGFVPYLRRGLQMPCSKSFAQRAIIAAALSEGTSHLSAYTACDDNEAAINVARSLGAEVGFSADGTLTIEGIGPITGPLPVKEFDAGESGLLSRLMIPVASALGEGSVSIKGKGTLLSRPLSGAVNKMASFGVMLRGEDDKQGKELHVPVSVEGRMIPGNADVSGADGSQLISGLLMALPLCGKPSNLYVGEPKSIPYMYITQDVMRSFGVNISTEMEGNAEMLELQDWSYCSGMRFRIPAPQKYRAADFPLEADWSAAANFLVAGAIFGAVEIEGLDSSSLQADISILDILVDAGAVVSETEDGVIGVRKAPLEAFEADLSNAPDLFPIASVLAAFCVGRSRLGGVGRLSGKESDRAGAIVSMLTAMGVETAIEGDDMFIQGEQLSSRIAGGRLLKGGRYSTRNDHRMAMALAVASLGADGPVEPDNRACVGKSFPGFYELFKQ